jgi:hypothetical protein
MQRAIGTRLADHTRVHGIVVENQRIERVAVAGERLGDEAVIGRVGRGREQATVEVDPPVLVVDLVLVTAPAGDLDDDMNAVRRWCLDHSSQVRTRSSR